MSLGTRCGKSPFSRQVDVVGWAAFSIRIGIAELGGIGWAWALLGISEIVLSVHVILWLNDEGTNPFMRENLTANIHMLRRRSVGNQYGRTSPVPLREKRADSRSLSLAKSRR